MMKNELELMGRTVEKWLWHNTTRSNNIFKFKSVYTITDRLWARTNDPILYNAPDWAVEEVKEILERLVEAGDARKVLFLYAAPKIQTIKAGELSYG